MTIYRDNRRGKRGKKTPCPYYVIGGDGKRAYCDGGEIGHEGTHCGNKSQHQYEYELEHGYRGYNDG